MSMSANTKKKRNLALAMENTGNTSGRTVATFSRVGIRAPKLSHLVAERLRAMIAAGELRPGDTLPSEAELLRQFNVSRPIMREALRVLEAESLIRLGRGALAGAIHLDRSQVRRAVLGDARHDARRHPRSAHVAGTAAGGIARLTV